MQDRLVTLDPSNADASAASQRSLLFSQRLHESVGGDVGAAVALQFGLTGGLVTYSQFRNNGFRMLPASASKMPRYSAIAMVGGVCWLWGRVFCMN